MSVLADIQTALSVLGIPIETGVFTDAAPAKYIVVVPIADTFDLHADNVPGIDVQEARLTPGELAVIDQCHDVAGLDFTHAERAKPVVDALEVA